MRFIQFYHPATGYGATPKGAPIEACGDRGVVILDARQSVANSAAIARQECIKRGYMGFTLHAGESFNRSRAIREYEGV